jgi:serine/threonine protein kinase
VIARLKAEGSRAETSAGLGRDGQDTLAFLRPPRRPCDLGRLANYDVLGVIGRGGMGVVLKAVDPGLNRCVAIKILAPQWATSAAARQRFQREARAAAAVQHDHVVAVYAVDEADGLPYLVMEYVQGVSLEQRLERTGPLEVDEIVRIGMQTAAGLAAAHAQGLIHRDVKPANILLEHGVERVKLSDFGLARAIDDASLTQSGVIAGTPLYMAPEQARGLALDHRADLFSLGSVLYALATGRPPFRAASTVAVLRRVCEDTPRPIRDINPAIPDWLVEIIEVLHAKDPAQRFQTAAEVSELLGGWLAHLQNPRVMPQPDRRRPPRRPGGRRAWRRWAVLALLLGAVTGAASWWALSGLDLAGKKEEITVRPGPVAKAPVPDAPKQEVAPVLPVAPQQPRVALTGGKAMWGYGKRLTYQVHYRFEQGSPAGAVRWVWVVRSGNRILHEGLIAPAQEGTLEATPFQPAVGFIGPIETFLAVDRPIPGQPGFHRETVSNTLILMP